MEVLASCPQCGNGVFDWLHFHDQTAVQQMDCDDCGAVFGADFTVETNCTGTTLVTRGTNWEEE